jgi:hypothetical protein
MQGYPHHPSVCMPAPAQVVHVKQYNLPGGHEEITGTIVELEKAKIIHPAHSPYNSSMWPVQKLDGTCT